MKKKLLSILLAATMLLMAQGIPAMAGSITGGSEVDSTGAAAPADPVHHCTKENDGSDYTDWSYVYFGSYPQTEVTGDALTAAITGASYDANGDAWVDGTKYRRISKSDTNYDGYFGDSIYRYFKWERIKWRVLKVNSSTMFVVADKGVDCKCYNDAFTSITWENCTLRNWLNNDFYGTALSSSEQGAIVSQTVVNEDNPDYNTEGGNDTTDKVYLISFSEVMNSDYGFCDDYNTDSVSRRVKVSDYAYARGAVAITSSDYAGDNCWWWLRSPGNNIDNAAVVDNYGSVYRDGITVDYISRAVVPALHINLSSDLWSIADDGTSEEGGGSGTGITGDNPNTGNNTNPGGNSGADTTQANPKETTLKGKLKAAKKAITVQWQTQADVSGYQIQYSTNKKFKQKVTKTKTVKKSAVTKVTIKKLKSGKKYYVRIRTYKTVNGTSYYSEWSKAKTVKTKK